eukprot:EST45963.1 Transmembrane domain-containing protein [Spironucleus salmonicida]
MFIIFVITIIIFAITVTQDDFSPKSTQLNSGGCWLFILFLHFVQSLCAFHSQKSIYSLVYLITKLLCAIFLFFVPVINDQILNSLWSGIEAGTCISNGFIQTILFFLFFIATHTRISYLIDSALTWLVAQRRRAHNKAADQTFDIDFCYIPNLWILFVQFVESGFKFIFNLIWGAVSSFLGSSFLYKLEVFSAKIFKFQIEIPYKFQNIYGLQFVNQDQNDLAGFITAQNFIKQIQQRSKNGDKVNLKVRFITPLDFCIVSKYIVDEYTNFYADSYFEGLHIQNIFRQQQIQIPYIKQLAFIAEAKFSNSQFIKLNYIITLRYCLNNIQEAQDQFNLQFEVDDDQTKDEKTKKFNQYQFIYQNIIEKILGQSTHLQEVMREVKKKQQRTLKYIKLESRINMQVVSANQTGNIQRLLSQWDELDKQFAQFWLYDQNLSQIEILNHIFQLKDSFLQFNKNIASAKQLSSGLFLYDVFQCAANRYFHLSTLNHSLYHKYQLFRARFQDGQAALVVEGDQSYKIINHYQPNYFVMKKRFNQEPQIVITHQVNQVQERTFEQNTNPVSIGQIQKGSTLQENITYGPDEKCKLQSDLNHFQLGNKQIKIFNINIFILLLIIFSLVLIGVITGSIMDQVSVFQQIESYSDILSQYLHQQLQNQIFIKIMEVLKSGQHINYQFQRLLIRLRVLSNNIQSTLHDNLNNLKPSIIYQKDIQNYPTQQTSHFLLKAVLLSEDISKDFVNTSDQAYIDFISYCFPITSNLILIQEHTLFIFKFIFKIVIFGSIIPLIVFSLNSVLVLLIRRDFLISASLFQNLFQQAKINISQHYQSFSKIRKRYYEIYGLSSISQYLDVVISGNYFDSEILTEQTLQDLLKSHIMLQTQDYNILSEEVITQQKIKRKSCLPYKKRQFDSSILNNLYQFLILFCIFVLIIINIIISVEFASHEIIQEDTNIQFMRLRDEIQNTNQEIILLQLARSYFINSQLIVNNSQQQELILTKFKDRLNSNNIDDIVNKISNYQQILGSVTQQIARNIQDLLSFTQSMRSLMQYGMFLYTKDPALDLKFDVNNIKNIVQSIKKQENCMLPNVTNNQEDLLKSPQDIHAILEELFFGCFTEDILEYIQNITTYLFKELEFQQQYHYIDKLQNIFITKYLIKNYYQYRLGFNQQDSLYIWPYINVNHPAYTTSHRDDFYKKTKYVVNYISSYLPGMPSQQLMKQLSNDESQANLLSGDITFHFQLIIIVINVTQYVLIILFTITFGLKNEVFLVLFIQFALTLSQILSLQARNDEYLMVQSSMQLFKIQGVINQDHISASRIIYQVYKGVDINYYEDIIDLISLTVKYHSMINIGRNERFPRITDELIPEQFQLEKHLYLALGSLLQINSLNDTFPIDIEKLDDCPLKFTLLLADSLQLFIGSINKQIGFLIKLFQQTDPDKYLQQFQTILQQPEAAFIRQIMEFNQKDIDSFYLNTIPADNTILPSIGFFDGHVQWTGYNWFNTTNLPQQLLQLSFAYENSNILYDIYLNNYQIKQQVSIMLQYNRSQMDNRFQILAPLYFGLSGLFIILFSICLINKLNNFIFDMIMKRNNIQCDDNFSIRQLYKFSKFSYIHSIFTTLTVVFTLLQLMVTLALYKYAVQQNQLLITQKVISQTQNNIAKLQGLVGCDLINSPQCAYAGYNYDILIELIQTSITHLLTPLQPYPNIQNTISAKSIRNNPQLITDHLSLFSAGSLFFSPNFILNIFQNQEMIIPQVYVDQKLNVSQIAYFDYLSDLPYQGKNITVQVMSIFNLFVTQGTEFKDLSIQLKFQQTLQMDYSIKNLLGCVQTNKLEIQDQIGNLSQISFFISLIFIVIVIFSWISLVTLYNRGKFSRFVLKKLRTCDLYNLPPIYSDASDI